MICSGDLVFDKREQYFLHGYSVCEVLILLCKSKTSLEWNELQFSKFKVYGFGELEF